MPTRPSPTSRSQLSADAAAPTTRSMSIRCGSRSRTPRRCSPPCGRADAARATVTGSHPLNLHRLAVSRPSTMPAVRRRRRKENRKVPRIKIPANDIQQSGRRARVAARPNLRGKGQAFDAGSSRHGHAAHALSRRAPADAWRAALDLHRHRRAGGRLGAVLASLSRQRRRSTIRRCSRSASAACSRIALRHHADACCRATAGCAWSCAAPRCAARSWPTAPGS